MDIIEVNSLVKKLKDQAKTITLSIPKLEISGNAGQLHAQSLDLLMGIIELENKLCQQQTQAETKDSKETKFSSYDEEQEVKKVRSRLLRWGNNPDQINSRILTLFLKLNKSSNPVTIIELKKTYANDGEFDKNFAQMKMISERNHGKVFEVTDGIVDIWPKVKIYVDEFTKRVGV